MTAKLAREDIARASAYVRRVMPLPYRKGATGPDAFDCWGLARDCQYELFERNLPIVTDEAVETIAQLIADPSVRQQWRVAQKPSHGALALMNNTQEKHIGVWLALDGGGVLHTAEGAGVKFETLLMLRNQGWGRIHFHEYVGRT